jgi:hypothetical protein
MNKRRGGSMTGLRQTLLLLCPIEASYLGSPHRKQLNDCVKFGWATLEHGFFHVTPEGSRAATKFRDGRLSQIRRQLEKLAVGSD